MATEAENQECHLRELLGKDVAAIEKELKWLDRSVLDKFQALEKSIAVAADVNKDHLKALNEVRLMVTDWRMTFEVIGKADALEKMVQGWLASLREGWERQFGALKENMERQINALKDATDSRVGTLEKERANWAGRLTATAGIFGVALLLANMAISFAISQWGK